MSEPTPASFEPNYKRKCISCGRKPTIRIVPDDGSAKVNTDMCGACTWGEADCIDPDNW